MPERPKRPRPPRLPRFSDLADVTDDMITFVEKYQRVWEAESKAMLALGEFLGQRSESMRFHISNIGCFKTSIITTVFKTS